MYFNMLKIIITHKRNFRNFYKILISQALYNTLNTKIYKEC